MTLPATLDSLERVRAFAHKAAEFVGVDSHRTYALELALDEIVTNIVSHGSSPFLPDAKIGLRAEVVGSMLRITIEDCGPPFDPRTQEMPTEEELNLPLEKRAIGGLGIFLAIKGVDRFDYRRINERNENIFEVCIGGLP